MPSAVSNSFASLGAFLSSLTFPSSFAALQEESDAFLEPAQDVAPPPEIRPSALPLVQVFVIGGALSPATLQQALGPHLHASYDLQFSSSERFSPREFLRARFESREDVRVWVDTTTSGTAHLYFANGQGTRYLVRTIELSTPLDEMDREALAQAIEWSLQALSEGTAGMSRAEAEALLTETSEPASSPPEKEGAQADDGRSASWRQGVRGALPEVAFLYRWAPFSGKLPATQGPALRIGLDWLSAHRQIGFGASTQYQYSQRYAAAGVAIELQGVAPRFDLRYLATGLADGFAMGLSLGFGVDALFSSHEAIDLARYEATERSTNVVPLLTGGLFWQFRVEPKVRLELNVGAEVDLIDLHYDVQTSEGTTRLLSRWPARPSASVGIELF